MSLKKVSDILKNAQKNNYAVPAFNVFNFESIAWLIEAAGEENLPVIAMLYPGCASHIPISTFVKIVKDLAQKVEVPVGLHFDHSNSFEEIMKGIKYGFPSVMIDGSALDYEENINLTKEVVKTAHALDIDVEAELGFVGSASKKEDFAQNDYYTDPAQAENFVDKTEVDSLAVAIGSAHGNYISTPELDLDRLKQIEKRVNIPLVLHGGSGIPKKQVKQAVKLGINKLNIGTEFNQIFYQKMKAQTGRSDKESMLGCMSDIKSDIKGYFKEKIKLLR